MDIYRIIDELAQERNRLAKIIHSLENMTPSANGEPDLSSRRGRKSMDIAARREVSERMKRYWAQRRQNNRS